MKKLTIALLSSAALLWAAGSALAAGPHLKPGLWEIHVKTVMPGMPFTPPPQTMKKCITPKDAQNPWRQLQENKQQQCRFSGLKFEGNRAEWQMSCQGQSAMQGSGTAIVDDPTHYHGTSDMTSEQGGMKMKIHVETKGHWTGACP